MKKAIYKILKIYKKQEEIINYLVVGGLTTIISLVVYYICVATFLNPKVAMQLQIANMLSWIIAATFAYIANRKAVFKSKNNNIKREVIKFFGARLTTLLIDMLFMFLTVSCLNLNDKIMKIISNLIIIILNYVFSKIFVFKGENK